MREHRLLSSWRALALAPLFLALGGCVCAGMKASAAPALAATAAPAQLGPPDWAGVWDTDWATIFGPGAAAEKPVLTPAAAKQLAAYEAARKKGENQQGDQANCVPPGLPQSMSQPYPVEFLFTPGKVTIAIEAYSQMRRVFMDGRARPEDPDPTYQGYSLGHWEGDTLVIETSAVLADTMLAPGIGHSDALTLVERVVKTGSDTMEIKTTMTDPAVLAEPWTITRRYIRKPGWDIKEYICVQNNRDSADDKGRAGFDLSGPEGKQ
jgi:hypothetical protein